MVGCAISVPDYSFDGPELLLRNHIQDRVDQLETTDYFFNVDHFGLFLHRCVSVESPADIPGLIYVKCRLGFVNGLGRKREDFSNALRGYFVLQSALPENGVA
jgi:hypothetical protein